MTLLISVAAVKEGTSERATKQRFSLYFSFFFFRGPSNLLAAGASAVSSIQSSLSSTGRRSAKAAIK